MRGSAGAASMLAACAAALACVFAQPAQAGVPRSCVHPVTDPLVCAEDTRAGHRDVLPSARLRALAIRDRHFERVIPLQDAERNALLREIRDELRAIRAPR